MFIKHFVHDSRKQIKSLNEACEKLEHSIVSSAETFYEKSRSEHSANGLIRSNFALRALRARGED